ncbi:MAG: AAA domain-containing protein [bacterium]|nr:AAA domain-containing protein [bacterium]
MDDLSAAPHIAATEPVFPVILICHPVGGRIARLDEAVLDTIAQLRRASSLSQIVLVIPPAVGVDTCCLAIEQGASDFVEMRQGHVDGELLARRLDQARQRYDRQVAAAESIHSRESYDQTGIVAQSRAMSEVLSRAARTAQISDVPVLIHGESGTGKQLIAELIHRLDAKRAAKPLLTINCAAITGSLAESALFGHVKGAFTGATQERAGYFRAAHRGTILLDEIGELELCLQPKLLRVLQEGLILPVGSDTEVPVDVRILAASNRNLGELIERGRFRLDLYQRLNVVSVEIPPLRNRPEDIEALVMFFVRKYSRYYGRRIVGIDQRVFEFLSSCPLQGNVRELENAVRRMLAMKTSGDEIVLADLPESLRRQWAAARSSAGPVVSRDIVENAAKLIEQGVVTLPDFVAECERQVLADVLGRFQRSKTDLAQALGLSRRTFYNKRRKYGL